jgi:hypothetical protein
MKQTVIIFFVIVSLFSCNVSSLLPDRDDDDEEGPRVLSFAVLQSENAASVTKDYYGLISGNQIFLTLPYIVVAQNKSIKPQVILAPGYAVNPQGSYHVYDGMGLTVTNPGRGTMFMYTLHVSIDQATVNTIQLNRPFYIKDDGSKVDMTGYTFSVSYDDASSGTITVHFDTEQYGVDGPAVLDEIFTKKIGFYDVTVPFDAVSDVANAVNGAYLPYTVSTTTSTTTTFQVEATRRLRSDTSFVSLAYTVKQRYTAVPDIDEFIARADIEFVGSKSNYGFLGYIRDGGNSIQPTADQLTANLAVLYHQEIKDNTTLFTASGYVLPLRNDPGILPSAVLTATNTFFTTLYSGGSSVYSKQTSYRYTVDHDFDIYETVTITYPPGVTVASVTPYSIIQNYTYVNNVLTFYFKSYTDQFS